MKLLGKFVAFSFPWLIFLLEDNLVMALVAIVLQATIIGWIPMIYIALQHKENLPYFATGQQKPKASSKQEEES